MTRMLGSIAKCLHPVEVGKVGAYPEFTSQYVVNLFYMVIIIPVNQLTAHHFEELIAIDKPTKPHHSCMTTYNILQPNHTNAFITITVMKS